jgi:26S proteasome regulatory subunit N8
LQSLKGLHIRLEEIKEYLAQVTRGELPVNHPIIYNLQDVFNLLPNLEISELARSFSVQTNDQMLIIYVSALIRAVIAIHNLINNKVSERSERCWEVDLCLILALVAVRSR